ncbi:MAG: type II toxin-antitoxin system RelE family toxin [Candidatus Aenigmatarchaeota archaeon]|jgi:mRNA interferase RelE/StbE
MKYENEIFIHKDAVKFLKKLNPKLKEKIKKVISVLRFFPLVRLDIAKLAGYENIFRVRIGKVRILFEYQEKERKIFIKKIGFREGFYSNF